MKTKIVITISIIIVLVSGIFLPLRFLFATEQLTPIIIIPGVGGSLNWQIMTDKGPNAWGFPPTVNEYKHLIDTLEARGYVLNKNLFVAFYDWRQSNILSATQYLKPVIDTATRINNTRDVYIIAHSMGGLVTRAYLENNNDYRVAKVIMLGTPNNGSSDTYTLWENGELPNDFQGGRRAIVWFYLWYLSNAKKLSPEQFQSVQQYVQSTRELMPTYDYLKTADTNEIIPYATHKQNPNTLSRNAFLENLNHYSKIQNMINHVFETHIIAGTGEQTLQYVPVVSDNDTSNAQWTDGVPSPNPPVKDTDQGDGTVLVESAFIKNLDIHKRIFMVRSVWGKIVSLFRPHPNPLPIKEGGNDNNTPLAIPSFVKKGADIAYAGDDDEYTHEEYIQNCINKGKTQQQCQTQLENYFLSSSYPIKLHTIASTHGDLPKTAIPKIFEILELGEVPTIQPQPPAIQRLLQLWIGSPVSATITAPDGLIVENMEIATSGGDDPIQIISIPEPEQGDYHITLTGTGTGEYHLGASLLSDTEQSVHTVAGSTQQGIETNYTLTIPQQPQEHTESQTLFQTQSATTDYTLSLSKGWNLISIPADLPDPSVESFFGAHTQFIDSLWAYDATQSNPWMVYRPMQPELSLFSTLSPGYGYWVHWSADTPLMLTKEITPLESGPIALPSRVLVNGWNLIGGYHISDTRPSSFSTAFQTLSLNNQGVWKSVFGYGNDTKMFQQLPSTGSESAGLGYWLFVQNKKGLSIFAP